MNSWQKELSHINQSRFCFIAFSHIWYSFCFPNIKLSTFSCQQLQWVIFIFDTFCLIFLEFSAFLNRTTTVPGATASQDLTNMHIFVAKCKFLQRHYHQLSDGTLLLLVARWIYSQLGVTPIIPNFIFSRKLQNFIMPCFQLSIVVLL